MLKAHKTRNDYSYVHGHCLVEVRIDMEWSNPCLKQHKTPEWVNAHDGWSDCHSEDDLKMTFFILILMPIACCWKFCLSLGIKTGWDIMITVSVDLTFDAIGSTLTIRRGWVRLWVLRTIDRLQGLVRQSISFYDHCVVKDLWYRWTWNYYDSRTSLLSSFLILMCGL